MRCLDGWKIQAFVDGRAETKEYGQMMTHLSECEMCQAKVEEEKRLSHFVKRAALVYGEIGSLEKTILTKIDQLRRKPQWIPTPEPVSILRWIQPWEVQTAAFWIAAVFLGGWLGLIIETPLSAGAIRELPLLSGAMNGSLVSVLSERSERGKS
jgi:anti-sigma factor RsiW